MNNSTKANEIHTWNIKYSIRLSIAYLHVILIPIGPAGISPTSTHGRRGKRIVIKEKT